MEQWYVICKRRWRPFRSPALRTFGWLWSNHEKTADSPTESQFSPSASGERGRFKSRAWNKNCLSMFSCWSMWKCGDVCILIWTLEPVNLTQHDAHLFGERGWMGIRGLRGSGSEMNALPRGCRWDLLSPSTWPAVKFYFIFSKPRVNLAFIQEIKLKFCWHET